MSNSTFAIVSVDPSAEYEWNRCNVRELFSGSDINFKQLATAGLDKGDYLVRLIVSVEIVTCNPQQEVEQPEREALERDYSQSIAF